MVLPITEDIIRERFANVQISVLGERTLIQKLLPVIEIRERRLAADFLPISLFTMPEIQPLCMDVVAFGALHDALPMLDVVLTPNGLATVGNNNLSPASAARSEAARSAVASLLFQAQDALLSQLRRNEEWLDSKWALIFRRSLFVALPDLCSLDPDRSSDSFEIAKAMQLKAAIAEDGIAQRYISPALMEHLRIHNIADSLSPDEEHVVSRIRDAVRLKVTMNGKSGELLVDVVEYIRQRPLAFPLWHRSRVSETFKDHRFRNDSRSGGFFF